MNNTDELLNDPSFMKKVPLASDANNAKMWSLADRSKPNDFIKVSYSEAQMFEEFWRRFVPSQDEYDDVLTPSDLVIAGTVPLTDCILEIDFNGYGKPYRFRIVIFEEYTEVIQAFLEGGKGIDTAYAISVGICVRQFTDAGTGNEIGFPITISRNNNFLNNVEEMYYRKVPDGFKQDEIPFGLAANLQSHALNVWYGIQLALLNPVTKDVFIPSGKEKYKDLVKSNRQKDYRKGPTRYIKSIRMNESEFKKLLNGTGNPRQRHTLAWRVIGHWRHYKNGKSVFVKPYWKGLMKDIQKQDYRNREIVVNI